MKVNTTTALRNFTQEAISWSWSVALFLFFMWSYFSPKIYSRARQLGKTKKTKNTHLIFENFGVQFQKKICVGGNSTHKNGNISQLQETSQSSFQWKGQNFWAYVSPDLAGIFKKPLIVDYYLYFNRYVGGLLKNSLRRSVLRYLIYVHNSSSHCCFDFIQFDSN